jgi:RNA polymerase sigma factor (sigma-70 family)
LDFCKKANRQGRLVSIDDDVGADEYQARSSPNDITGHPELAYLSKERSSELERQLDSMPVIYKKVIYSSAVDEMSCSEIAELEGVPVKTISSRLYRGRKLLHSLQEHTTKGGKKQ